jgi:hypothetical protein
MKITAFCLCWLLILTAPGVMAQQPTTPSQSSTVPNQSPTAPNQSWELLRQLQTGENIEVERKTGKKKVSGDFVSLFDTELVIRREFSDESLSRDEVKRIWQVDPPGSTKRVLSTMSGGGAGFTFGFLLGLLFVAGGDCGGDCGPGETGLVAATIAASAVGALVGYFRVESKRTLIYVAP